MGFEEVLPELAGIFGVDQAALTGQTAWQEADLTVADLPFCVGKDQVKARGLDVLEDAVDILGIFGFEKLEKADEGVDGEGEAAPLQKQHTLFGPWDRQDRPKWSGAEALPKDRDVKRAAACVDGRGDVLALIGFFAKMEAALAIEFDRGEIGDVGVSVGDAPRDVFIVSRDHEGTARDGHAHRVEVWCADVGFVPKGGDGDAQVGVVGKHGVSVLAASRSDDPTVAALSEICAIGWEKGDGFV